MSEGHEMTSEEQDNDRHKNLPFSNRHYKATLRMQDGDVPVFGGAFNLIDRKYFDMFASVNRNRVCI